MATKFNKFSKKGATFTRLHEGVVLRWYLDPADIPTIGIGFTWRSAAFRSWWAKNRPGVKFERGVTMTREEADDCLLYLVNNEYGEAVDKFLGKKVPQHVFDGTVSPVYNMGPGSLKWTWAAAVKRGDYSDAARRLERTGTTSRGKVYPGLVRRRKEEARLIRDGVYAGVDTAHTSVVMPSKKDAMADGILERGEAGPAVAQMLRDLAGLKYYDGKLDDIFGHGTQAAVVEFQRDHSLVADGKAGPITLAKISEVIKAGPSKEDRHPVKRGAGVIGIAALVAAYYEKLETFLMGLF